MVPIGYRPIIWHLMKYYAHYGHKDFILCLGYKADVIKNYFLNYDECVTNDFVLRNGGATCSCSARDIDDWQITFVDTGIELQHRPAAEGGPRAPRRRRDVPRQLHRRPHRRAAAHDDRARPDSRTRSPASSAVQPEPELPLVASDEDGQVNDIARPTARRGMWINGGFFVLKREIFDYMQDGEELVDRAVPAADRGRSS